MLLLCAKAHYVFHAGAVVPTAIKDQDFASGWKMLHIALEIHLTLLSIGRGGERHQAEYAGAHTFDEGLNGAALTGGVATLKEDDDPQATLFYPFLKFAEFGLKPLELFFVFLPAQFWLEFFFVFLPFQLWLGTGIVFFLLGHTYPPHNRTRLRLSPTACRSARR